ncbi:AAA family ATPase [Bremerella sp. JC770]|uniref:AAA family ATPase n=1 Tax=Bremerella sp. JC770 TaxID=3232137 RepID=UPI003459EA07
MKLRHLELENYGIHVEQSFAFETHSLQIVYGRNEAGKSTLLQAVRELLFGFLHAKSNPFAPDSTKKKMKATALLTMADGTDLQIVRRQGNKNTLSGTHGHTEIDEDRWKQLISGADQRLYEHVFGFSLKELATGEESLKEANLDEALFGGGLGRLHDYKELLKSIDEETESLFKSRGQKQKINAILSDIKSLKTELKQSSLRPVEYEEWLTEAHRCEEELSRLSVTLDKVYRKQQHLERLRKAHPLWIQCQAKRQQLAKLEAPQSFPADALEELSQTRRQAAKLSSEVETLTLDVKQLEQEIAAIQFNALVIESGETIRSLLFGIKEVQGYRRDIPLRTQDRQRDLDEAEAILRRIDPKLQLDQIAKFELTLSQRNKIQQLTKSYQRLTTEIESHTPEVERLDREIQEIESALAEIPQHSPEFIERLQAGVDPLRQSIARRDDLGSHLRKLQTDIKQRRVPIDAIAGRELDFASPLPLPLEPTIHRYESELQSLAEQIRVAEVSVRETADELATKNDELLRLEQSAELVSEEQLQVARKQRDQTWQLLRGQLTGKEQNLSTESNQTQADTFDQQLSETDQLADGRYHHAQMLADQQAMQATIRRLKERLASREQHLTKLNSSRQETWEAWTQEWKQVELTPKSPAEMLPWRGAYLALVETHCEVSQVEQDIRELDRRIDVTIEHLRGHELISSDMGTDEVVGWLESFLKRAQSDRQQYSQWTHRQQHNRENREAALRQNEKRQQQLATIQAEASEILSVFETLGKVDLETAADLIHAVEQVQAKLASADKLQQRVADMQLGLNQFAEQVEAVVLATGEPLTDVPPESAAQRLGTLLSEAEKQRGLRKELEIKSQVRSESLAHSQKELAEVEARLSQWRSQIDAETDEQLEVVSQVVKEKQKLERELAELETQLALVRESEPTESFQQALETLDVDGLNQDLMSATSEHAEARQQQEQVQRQLGEFDLRLREVDQTSLAVSAQGKIESLQSELSDCLDRLGPLLIAKEMLDRAMQAFREENSGQLLSIISDLIEQMTEGRYTQVEHDPDQEGGLILSGPNDLRRKPAELSTGTREQLYLAIRLAYIRHYCASAQPLPVLMDDILVNFDDARQLATLKVLMDFDPQIQIIMLTCHQPLVDKVQSLSKSIQVTRIDGQPVEPSPAKAKPKRKKSPEKSSTPSLF